MPENSCSTRKSNDEGFPDLHARVFLAAFLITSLLAITTAMGCHNFLVSRDVKMPLTPSVAFGAAMWLWWAAIALGMWGGAKRFPAMLTFTPRAVLTQALVGSLLCFGHLALIQGTLTAGFRWPVWKQAYASLNYLTVARFGAEWMAYALVYVTFSFAHLRTQREQDHTERLELQARLANAQLHALQAQLEPHFLFNTLNVLTSLVDLGRNREASVTLGHLETILRATLERDPIGKVALRDELLMVESYLEIQKIRFASRLRTHITSSPEVLRAMVPRFLLQPLVENAIKHGIGTLEEGGAVEATVTRMGNDVLLQVHNDASEDASKSGGYGIGHRNTRERLNVLYPSSHEFTIARTPGSYSVTIRIPFECEGQ